MASRKTPFSRSLVYRSGTRAHPLQTRCKKKWGSLVVLLYITRLGVPTMALNVKKILVPVKGDETGENAFRLACGLSKASKAKLHALFIIEVKQELPVDAEVDPVQGEAILGRIEAVGHEEKCQVEAECLQARHAGPAIVQEALERGFELIVLGIPFKRRLGQFSIGETASHILKNAPCPVILWSEQTKVTSVLGG